MSDKWAAVVVCAALTGCGESASTRGGAGGLAAELGAHQRSVPVVEGQKLGLESGTSYGNVVAISGDTLMAAPSGATLQVYERPSTTWLELQTITFPGTSPLVSAAAISGDTAVLADSNGGENGAIGDAWVFVREDGAWSAQQRLLPSDGEYRDYFGSSIAFWGDTVLVGAEEEDAAGTDAGAIYVFERSGTAWTQIDKITVSDSPGGFGRVMAVSGDTLVVGATLGSSSDPGAAYVFTRDGGGWSQQQRLPGPSFSGFGASVAVDGDTMIVGSPNEYAGATDGGSATVYVRSDGTWTQQQKVGGSATSSGRFLGTKVALSGDTALASARLLGSGNSTGAVYVFTRAGTTWTQEDPIAGADTASNDRFGTSLALWGTLAAFGAPGHDGFGSNAGAVYAFQIGSDLDLDGLGDGSDVCPYARDLDQRDTDGDGAGDACDADLDGDDVDNFDDVCPSVADDQADADGDGLGDACDDADGLDVDGDGDPNTDDNCPFVANDDQADADGDGLGDACDDTDGLDVDGDTVGNADDNCPFDANADQVDADADGLGDTCDDADGLDVDGDGDPNTDDNCPFVANPDQADADADGLGDACDDADGLDVDGDGVPNAADNCPFVAFADQADADGDGLGDVCDPRDDREADVEEPSNCETAGGSPWLGLIATLLVGLRRRSRTSP